MSEKLLFSLEAHLLMVVIVKQKYDNTKLHDTDKWSIWHLLVIGVFWQWQYSRSCETGTYLSIIMDNSGLPKVFCLQLLELITWISWLKNIESKFRSHAQLLKFYSRLLSFKFNFLRLHTERERENYCLSNNGYGLVIH